ncbi:nif-specific transcriptional activator NifA [Methylovirgula sp. HY1]|uniref:nif-specific transcriptional activator NifA n=1 Tax=Methylovirgula sp. HY1 TaxID=2822761 RepID=UPI001C5B6777|nr:nif-specific transcriptional activator NifA [Methylovirgula sp. HY1]QXX74978.1 Nif-specific regulatory protein [Methylovirgula sp. HY1]
MTDLDALARDEKPAAGQRIPLSDIALIGVYEISKILAAPTRLETTLANVVNLLSSFLQMRHGTIVLLGDDGVPDVAVGADWSEQAPIHRPQRFPQRAIDQIVATAVPLVVHNIADHELFDPEDVAALAGDGAQVSFTGVPIRAGDKVVGTLTVDRLWDGESLFRFDSDVRFLVMIANLIGQTVKLHRVVARDRDRLIEESHRLQKQIHKLQPSPMPKARMSGIIGDSPQIKAVMDKIAIVARSNATLLLRGESGTGKELFARALHELSPRASKAFVKVNCAALAESVLESELFGHEKGAFTGAIATRKGRFELADGGTLFLDEIGEISLAFQAKLLRVLQGGEFERVGGTKTLKADVRLIAATNKNLEEAVRKGEFRADLYYRISVVPMLLPPLRERTSDIPLLAAHFLEEFNQQNGRELVFSKEATQVLKSCYFPGNVRELENCVQRTATFAVGDAIVAADFACGQDQCLSATLWKGKSHEHPSTGVGGLGPLPPTAGDGSYAERPAAPRHIESGDTHATHAGGLAAGSDDANERVKLLDAMEKSGWVQAKAARMMGLTPRQIGYALRKHSIEIKKF